MGNPVSVMKRFMNSLTKTGARDGIDLAIRAASNGKYWNYNALKNSFLSNLSQVHSGKISLSTFLSKYCNINLKNTDTGALTGYDSGYSKTQYNGKNIIKNYATLDKFTLPKSSSTTIDGLKVIWPKLSGLTENQKFIIKGLSSSWLKGSLELIKKSYGISFGSETSACNTLRIQFKTTKNDSSLAWVSAVYNSVHGRAKELVLNINPKFKANTKTVEGVIEGNFTQERNICHELVHALVIANVPFGSEMSLFLQEGIAELVHGIDDTRWNQLERCLKKGNLSYLKQSMAKDSHNFETDSIYAGSVAFLRYLAKTSLSDAYRYTNSKKTAMALTNSFTGTFSMGSWSGLTKVDARENKKTIAIKGTVKADTIYAGKGTTTVTAGSGDDIIYVTAGKNNKIHANNGIDTVKISGGTDGLIYADAGADQVTVSGGTGNKVYGQAGNDVITVSGGTNTIYGGAGADTIYIKGGKDGKVYANTENDKITLSKGTGYYVHGQEGNDVITVTGGSSNRYYGADGNDTFNIKGGNKDVYFGGEGLNQFIVDNKIKQALTLSIGTGKNRIKVLENFDAFDIKIREKSIVMASDLHTITINNWQDSHLEYVTFADGRRNAAYFQNHKMA